MSGDDRPERSLRFELNGRATELEVLPYETVAELLRDHLGLSGTKLSCEVQVCGSCTVLLDGMPISACTVLAIEVQGRSLLTIEGLTDADGSLHPLQQAFLDAFAFQCGFCTPGMILSAKSLLDEQPTASLETIIAHMDGNLCRCTGYTPILQAMRQYQTQLAAEA